MNKITCMILTFLFSVSLFAQNVTFYDTFDDDKNQWSFNNDGLVCKIDKGQLIVENSSPNTSKWRLLSLIEKPDEVDFDIETTITLLKTPADNATYGLVWSCYNDYTNYRVLQLSANKQYQVYHYYSKDFDYNKKWEASNAVAGTGKKNRIKIVKRANTVKMYVNDALLYQSGQHSYFGSLIGFILDAGTTLAVEDLKITEYPQQINVIETYDPNLVTEKLPATVSSADYDELCPAVSADGNILFITRNHPKNIENSNEDIWFSTKDAKGNWTELQNMGKPLNNSSYNFVISISPDENTLVLANTYMPDGSSKGQGLSISRKQLNGWGIPQDIVIKNFENKSRYVGYFLSNDNKVLLMCIEKEGGFGDKDLYVSFVQDDNSWSTPLNLGKTINTFEDEANPFLASDGKTLYFASRGHAGYGYHDLFVAKRLDDSWTNWSQPKNLGNKINSKDSDLSYYVTAKGDKAYISKGGDIHVLDNKVKQDPVVLVKGKVYDSKTKKTVSAKIEYNNLKTNKNSGTAVSSPVDGSYSIVLPYGSLYSFMADKTGYYAITQNVDLTNLKEYKEMEVDLYLNPIEKGEIIRLNNIFFDSGKYDLLKESYSELDKLLAILNGNANMKIEISGHTDAVGGDSDNMTLSNNRANAVMNYLVGKGISKDRLSAKGYGETKFIATNETADGKQKNRRVEFIILEM